MNEETMVNEAVTEEVIAPEEEIASYDMNPLPYEEPSNSGKDTILGILIGTILSGGIILLVKGVKKGVSKIKEIYAKRKAAKEGLISDDDNPNKGNRHVVEVDEDSEDTEH